MELLTVLLMPAAFVYYSAGNRFSNLPAYRMAYGTGLVCGIVIALLHGLISGFLPWNTAHGAVLYPVVLLSLVLFPFVLGPALLNLLFLSPARERLHRTIPQLFGILSVYLPYIFIVRYPLPDVWILIMVPVLIVALIFLADSCLKRYLFTIRLGPTFEGVLFALLPVLVSLAILPLLVVLWHFCFHPLFYWIPSLGVTGISAGMRIKKYI